MRGIPRERGHGLLATLLATSIVVFAPAATAIALERAGLRLSPLAFVSVAAALSLAIASAGAAVWSRRDSSGDRVFGDLMLWGWIRRARADRRIANARTLLEGSDELSTAQRIDLLESLSRTLESRDARTHRHSARVARIAEAIAVKSGLTAIEVARIRTAAAVHDVGKLKTPSRILNKPAHLTEAEFEMVKRHPVRSAEMVSVLDDAALTAIVLHHHERIDGHGYPAGLAGEQIPIGARIIAVADTFDAITSTRPYRRGVCHRDALATIRREAGSQLDPAAVAVFLAYYSNRRTIVGWGVATSVLSRLGATLKGAASGMVGAPIGQGAAIAGTTAVIAVAASSAAAVLPAMPGRGANGSRPSASAPPAVPANRAAAAGTRSQGYERVVIAGRREAGVLGRRSTDRAEGAKDIGQPSQTVSANDGRAESGGGDQGAGAGEPSKAPPTKAPPTKTPPAAADPPSNSAPPRNDNAQNPTPSPPADHGSADPGSQAPADAGPPATTPSGKTPAGKPPASTPAG